MVWAAWGVKAARACEPASLRPRDARRVEKALARDMVVSLQGVVVGGSSEVRVMAELGVRRGVHAERVCECECMPRWFTEQPQTSTLSLSHRCFVRPSSNKLSER